MLYAPRFLHRFWALIRGFSWIPCPICKRRFGGHERAAGNELWISGRDSVAVCPRCVDEAKRMNAANGYPEVERPGPKAASGGQAARSP